MPAPTVNGIPEELLREILKYEFDIPLHDIFVTFRLYFLKQRIPKPLHLLLVCKHWLHVATPLYYEFMELETEQDVEQFAKIIARNSAIGAMVRHLRIDGGYGRQLGDVVRHMRHIRTLSIQAAIISRKSNAGLFQVLPLLNPAVLYFHNEASHHTDHNRKTRANSAMIWNAAMKWTALEQIILCDSGSVSVGPGIFDVVATAPSLSIIAAYEWQLASLLRERSFWVSLQRGKCRTLKCFDTNNCLENFMARASVPQNVRDLVVYANTPTLFDRVFSALRESPSLML